MSIDISPKHQPAAQVQAAVDLSQAADRPMILTMDVDGMVVSWDSLDGLHYKGGMWCGPGDCSRLGYAIAPTAAQVQAEALEALREIVGMRGEIAALTAKLEATETKMEEK